MKDIKDHFEDLHDRKICHATRTIKLFGGIDLDKQEEVVTNLHLLDQTDGEITILLSTDGGCVTAGLVIVDFIKLMKNYVRIIAMGEVASMGTVILQAADKGRRFILPNSYLLIHEGETSRSGKERDIKQQKRLQDWQEARCIDIYWNRIKEKKPRYTRKKLMEETDKEWYLFPKEAVDLGLVDEILETY